jgi:ribose transport system permease protein
MSAATGAVAPNRAAVSESARDWARRNRWTLGLVGMLVGFLAFTKAIGPGYGAPDVQNLAIGALPIALAAVAQAIVVISGGIDLSVGSIMALSSVTAAVLMKDQGDGFAVAVVIAVLLLGLAVGAINGAIIVATRVPDIVVTLAMSFVWAGVTLLVLQGPGGGAAGWFKDLISGSIVSEWIPRALVVLIVVVGVVWIPLRRSILGLSLYAVGSDRLAAFRTGVPVGWTKIVAYALTGLFCALGGLAITASTGQGSPVPGAYTLQSVAAIVLGGVSLAGGRGGILGPILAVFVLQLVRTDLTFLEVNPNFATVIQGAILIGVVLLGSLLAMRRARA